MKDQPTYAVKWFEGSDNANEGAYAPLGTLDAENLTLQPMDAPPCPKCNGAMRLRTRKADHNQFWGCADFPRCTGCRNYNPRQETALRAFRFAVAVVTGSYPPDRFPKAEVKHCSRCRKCRKLLTNPESNERLEGPECSGEGYKRARKPKHAE